MEYIDIIRLTNHETSLRQQWNDSSKPFRYLVFDDLLVPEKAEAILSEYPDITQGEWDGTTYIHQKNKYTKTKFGSEFPNLQHIF